MQGLSRNRITKHSETASLVHISCIKTRRNPLFMTNLKAHTTLNHELNTVVNPQKIGTCLTAI